jgi:cytidylate kinase
MGIVTLTGHLGSMGDVGTLVAKELGYRLVGREIINEAAETLGWPVELAQNFDERTGGFGRWFSDLLERVAVSSVNATEVMGMYAMPYGDAVGRAGVTSDQYMEALTAAMTAFADQGDVVLVGRGGQALFANRPDAVHIRVACPVEERARRIARRDNVEVAAAQATIEESDRQREAWHAKYLGIDYRSPYHYSLVVNTGRLNDESAAAIIADAVRRQLLVTSM